MLLSFKSFNSKLFAKPKSLVNQVSKRRSRNPFLSVVTYYPFPRSYSAYIAYYAFVFVRKNPFRLFVQ